jgi:hypothetical protein
VIDVKKIGILIAVLVALTWGSLAVHDWWGKRETQLSDQIAALKAGIAARDVRIASQDAQLALLKKRDASIVKVVAQQNGELTKAKADLATTIAQIDAEALTHAGLVPIARVHVVEAEAANTIASCENIKTAQGDLIANLREQIANQALTRTLQDTNRVAGDSVLRQTVAILKPPWWKRTFSWIGGHGTTLGIGGGIALFVEHVIVKK